MKRSILLALALLVAASASPVLAQSANFQANCVTQGDGTVDCVFDATRYYYVYPATSCPGGTVAGHWWTFGDGGNAGFFSYMPIVSHTYNGGVHDVYATLIVKCSPEAYASRDYRYNPSFGFIGAIYPDCGWNPPCTSPPA